MEVCRRGIGAGRGGGGDGVRRAGARPPAGPAPARAACPRDGVERLEPAAGPPRPCAPVGRHGRPARRRGARGRHRRGVPGAAGRGVGRDRAATCSRAACACSTCRARSVCATAPRARGGTRRPARCRRGIVYGLTGAAARRAAGSARWCPAPGATRRRRCSPSARSSSAGLVAGDIVIDAKSGVSGAGKAPSERTHFSECHGSVSAYGVFAHRHAAEIEQELGVARHVRAAPRAARPRHSRDDLHARARGHDGGRDCRDAIGLPTPARRSCG